MTKQSQQQRSFEDREAVRERVPLMLGLVGPSGSGKTYSALRLASGIQKVTGGDIFVIDTEARRALHYAERFKFRHLPFGKPFSPLDYLAAIRHCADKGAGVIIVDSMSHEHEGPGGVLEWHAAETERLANAWKVSHEKAQMSAWAAPKQARRELINSVLQIPCNFIFCFRAKDKLKIIPGKNPQSLGWMPIAGEEFVYELTVSLLLPPATRGVPELEPKSDSQREIFKVPEQFSNLFIDNDPLSERHGEEMAKWAVGGAAPVAQPNSSGNANASKVPVFRGLAPEEWKNKPLTTGTVVALRDYWDRVNVALEKEQNERARGGIQKHLDDIKNALDAAEADAALDGAAE